MKRIVKRMLSCTLAVLCAANSVPIFSASAEQPMVLTCGANVFTATASEGGFTASDYSAERTTVNKHVEFKINTAEITADELEEMGYTISEDRTTASKDATLAKITYTFDKLPTTLEELKEFSLASDVQGDYDYGMFAPMAATILAIHAFGTDKEEAYKMFAYAYGSDQTFSNFDKQFVQTQFATAANTVLQNCYFGGAAPENGYKPDEPFTITLEEGPYVLKEKNGIPERHMSFIYFAGADSERYMDVCKSSDGTWYAYEGNYKHLLASVKEATAELPDWEVEDVPESERYYTEKHDTVTKHVEFKINTAEITANELEELGYTISEDRSTASKDVTLAKITYTFDKLPTTLDELKKFSLKSNMDGDYDYGMFAPMAATILAIHAYGTDKEEAYKMLEYLYGPNQTFSNFDKQFVQTQFATEANKVLQNCYFGGASPENGYKPDEPFTITLEEGPYFIKASNGKPERHMSFIYFDGADSERYMDVFKSSGGTWYAYESNYKHLLASVKEATGEPTDPTDPTDPPEGGLLGDLNSDDTVNASDAALILIAAASNGAGNGYGLTDKQERAAEINNDGTINASDAALVLIYAAAAGAGQDVGTLEEYLKR